MPFWLFFWHFFPTFWLLYRWYNPSSIGGCDRINTHTFCQRLCQLYTVVVKLTKSLTKCKSVDPVTSSLSSGSTTCKVAKKIGKSARFVPFWLFFWHFFPTFWLLYRWYNSSSMGGCDRINTLTFCQRLCQLYNHSVCQILAHGLQKCGRGYKNGYRTLSGSNTCAFYGQVSINIYILGVII